MVRLRADFFHAPAQRSLPLDARMRDPPIGRYLPRSCDDVAQTGNTTATSHPPHPSARQRRALFCSLDSTASESYDYFIETFKLLNTKGTHVKVLKALADETRLGILRLLNSRGEMSCRALSEKIPLTQPTLSHHFGKLQDADVLRVRKSGVHHFYSVNVPLLKDLGINLEKLTAGPTPFGLMKRADRRSTWEQGSKGVRRATANGKLPL